MTATSIIPVPAIAVFALLTMGYFLHRRRVTSNLSQPHLGAVRAIRAILDPPETTLLSLLAARAGCNQRLQRSFDLRNTFVSGCPEVHHAFVSQALGLIRTESTLRARATFSELSSTIASTFLEESTPHNPRIPFADIVQLVTFKAILCTLFGADLSDLADDDILCAARAINDIWQWSKQPTPPPDNLLPKLQSLLHDWLPTYENPLDFIIPTYETMWRVVAVLVATVHMRSATRDSFERLLADPGRHQFQQWSLNDTEPSVEAVVNEVMRLYPPTRRISRIAVSASGCNNNNVQVAEIGSLHRDIGIWGPSASIFDPTRFHPSILTATQKGALLGFGYGSLKCVAKDWAPLTAALIAASILNACKESYTIVEGGSIGGRSGWEGWWIELIA